jgi:hypothetical protein
MSKRNRKSAIAEARNNDQPSFETSAVVSLDSSHESQVENPGRHVLSRWPIAPPAVSGPTQPVSSR